MELYTSKYQTIRLVDQGRIVEKIWTSCEDMSHEDFRYEQLRFKQILEQHKPTFIYIEATHLTFVIDVCLQAWNAENILNYFSSIGGRKIAVLRSTELISRLALEQTFDEVDAKQVSFVTQYFDNEFHAKSWLIKETSNSN